MIKKLLYGIAMLLVVASVHAVELPTLLSGKTLHYKFNKDAGLGETTRVVHDYSLLGNDASMESSGSSPTWSSTGGKFGDGAFEFDGSNDKIIVPDADSLSPAATNAYTIAFWIKFNRTKFVGEGNTKSYINFLGKADAGQNEFMFRYFNSSNPDNRPNRISFYMFNPDGGLGAGSYVQEPIRAGEWMHLVGVYDGRNVQLWKNGVLKDSDPVSEYNIRTQNTNAPLRIGTVTGQKYFRGSFDEVKVYNRALSRSEIEALYSERL
ncbi:MAG: LamG domain-containing protein [Candidatus Nanoarchaeia archaeon]